MKAAKITSIGAWADWAWVKNKERPVREEEAQTVELGMTIEVQNMEVEDLPWRWKIGAKMHKTWELSTRTCKTLFMKHDRDRESLVVEDIPSRPSHTGSSLQVGSWRRRLRQMRCYGRNSRAHRMEL
ncbi:hypothetical protein R1sor_026875 [Riccia sorocarpa]|uniref:Uncharacterized protein n=1 Tax=Riccia sorocarpa TaxID=122646 RepID=A0ABD3GFI7_9MARC